MEEKITPQKINEFLFTVEKQIRYIENDIETLETIGARRRNNQESMSVSILTKELEKLKNDLEVFKHMDIKNIKDGIFEEKFMLLLEELK